MLKNISLILLCALLIAVTMGEAKENTCGFGKYGTNCSADCDCNQNRSAGSCSYFGHCHCLDGYWGNKCERRCDRNCPLNKCNLIGGCICEDFTYGKYCNRVCHCDRKVSSGCDLSGRCLCKIIPENETLNGSLCSENKFCDEHGQCRCKGWKYGARCNRESTCDRNNSISPFPTGGCICKEGYYGENCESECPTDCQNSFWHNSCKFNGACNCRPNYYGLKCQNRCNCTGNRYCDFTGRCRLSRLGPRE
ncbi:unnamed protein product [Gordionus sp. m RMFG-2023]|uniref:cell death abnormality protein 1-like n=1 Tax=Gordionus sp. m RMFG-2023 TaxID=3053472 RepID=UPI0030DE916D